MERSIFHFFFFFVFLFFLEIFMIIVTHSSIILVHIIPLVHLVQLGLPVFLIYLLNQVPKFVYF